MELIKAVLFDLDGVLVDAPDWHYEALNKALSLFGFLIPRGEHEAYYNGLPTRRKLEKLTGEKGLPAALHNFINDMKQRYTVSYIHEKFQPDFSKQIMMKVLRDRGIKIAVCSNAIRNTVELILEKSYLKGYINLILSNEDVKNNKPDPEMYLLAMERFGVKPEETVIVEDAPHGVEAARKSGAHVIVVKNAAEVNLNIFKKYFSDL